MTLRANQLIAPVNGLIGNIDFTITEPAPADFALNNGYFINDLNSLQASTTITNNFILLKTTVSNNLMQKLSINLY